MAVKFIKKSSKAIKESAPTADAPPADETASPKPYKKSKAIEDPHQFTVKMFPRAKTKLKILAATLDVSNTTLYTNALRAYLADPPECENHRVPPEEAARFVFKVTKELAEAVHERAKVMDTTSQNVICYALERLMDKHGVSHTQGNAEF